MAGWSMSVIVLLMRCFCAPDFQLIEISILAPTPVQEQVTSFPLLLSTVFTLRIMVFWVLALCNLPWYHNPHFHCHENIKFHTVFAQLSSFLPDSNYKTEHKN